MSRKKLPESEKKVKLSITLDVTLNKMLNELTTNKSKLIENLVKEHLNKFTITENIEIQYDENNNYIGRVTTKIINENGKNL